MKNELMIIKNKVFKIIISNNYNIDNIIQNIYITNYDNNNYISLNNRKYIWSKYKLLNFIENIILEKVSNIDVFIDWFAWTWVVWNHFRKFSNKIISNDLLFSNYVVNQVFLNSSKGNINFKKVKFLFENLNNLTPKKWYIYKNFSDTYFTSENAWLIDAIREEIENYYEKWICNINEKYILLSSLLFAVDKVSNTVWQYDAYLKNLWDASYKNWKHLVDKSVYKRIFLKNIDLNFEWENEVYNEDINLLIKKIEWDVLYLDPPYNHRQYIDCYHLLENIIKWQKPEVYWKTKKFKRDNLKSLYSRKRDSKIAFKELIENANVKHIFLSYNNEWIIEDEYILEVLNNKWEVEIFEQDYNIFWNWAWKSKKREIKERLFYCKVFINN